MIRKTVAGSIKFASRWHHKETAIEVILLRFFRVLAQLGLSSRCLLVYLQAAVPFNAILAYLYLYVDVLSITHRLEKVFCKATEGTLIIDKIEKGTVRGRSGFSEGE